MTPLFDVETAEELLSRPNAPFKLNDRHRSGGWITFPNGWTVSVQWSGGNYGSNYDFEIGQFPAPPAATAEIAIWKGDKADLQEWEDGDTVQGWLSWEDVQRVLDLCEHDRILTTVTTHKLVASRDEAKVSA